MKAVGKNNMQTQDVEQAGQVWPSVARVLFVPHTDQEYEELVSVLDTLIDIVGENEQHPLASLMEVIGVLVEKYEDENVPEITDF
jgi:HTH-type transcriptional regulator / antitoxin HigA